MARSFGRSPYGVRLLADLSAVTVPAAIHRVRTDGCVIEGIGPASLHRLGGAPSLYATSNRAVKQDAAGAYFELDYDGDVKVTQFGALVYGDTEDAASGAAAVTTNNTALANADAFCKAIRPGFYVPLIFPGAGRMRTSAATALSQGMTWISEGRVNASDSQNSFCIYNNTTDILTQMTADVRDAYFAGILFDGANQNNDFFSTNIPSDTSTDLRWSKFLYCGFKNFAKVFYGTMTGCYIVQCNINDSDVAMYLKGSDNWVMDNLIGSNNGLITEYVVTLDFFALSRFERNFITGEPNTPIRLISSCEGTRIRDNWFDIADGSGLYGDGAHGCLIEGNTFNKLGANNTPHATLDGEIRLHNCYDIVSKDNAFQHSDTSTPVPSAFLPTHKITSSTSGASHDVYIDDVQYLDAKVRNISVDANSHYPRVSKRMPLAPFLVANATSSWKAGQSHAIICSTTLSANRTTTLLSFGAYEGQEVDLMRTDGAAFQWIVNNNAGTMIKTFGSGVNGCTKAIFRSTDWICA